MRKQNPDDGLYYIYRLSLGYDEETLQDGDLEWHVVQGMNEISNDAFNLFLNHKPDPMIDMVDIKQYEEA